MIAFRLLMALFLALPVFCEPAEIMYYNSFGEYLTERPYQIDMDIHNASLREILAVLKTKRNKNDTINSDLVLIGYGAKGTPQDFFAATKFVNYEIPLRNALEELPTLRPDAKWYIIFVDKSLSHYVRAREDHHWSSPFRWLAQIGLQDLHYFGPY